MKLAINLSIHTQHTYDKGVDRTGRQGMEEKYSITWGERGEKKNLPPDYAPLGSTVWEQKKNTSAQKHIYHKLITLQQGETYPALASSHPVRCHLFRRRSQTRFDSLAVRSGRRQLVGGWSNVCNRGGSKRVPLQRSSQGSYPARPWPRPVPVRGSQKR